MLNAKGQYVLFVCEGVAEQYILTTLIERGELTVPNELIGFAVRPLALAMGI